MPVQCNVNPVPFCLSWDNTCVPWDDPCFFSGETTGCTVVTSGACLTVDIDCVEQGGDTITVAGVTGCTAPYYYSIDGYQWQLENTFTDLNPGHYNIFIQDACGCCKTFEHVYLAPAPEINVTVICNGAFTFTVQQNTTEVNTTFVDENGTEWTITSTNPTQVLCQSISGYTSGTTVTACTCPDGWADVEDELCQLYEYYAVTASSTSYVATGHTLSFNAFNDYMRYYESSGLPTPFFRYPLTGNTSNPPVKYFNSGGVMIDVPYVNLTPMFPLDTTWKQYWQKYFERENPIWTTASNASHELPVCEQIGFSVCIDIPETREYLLFMRADNMTAAKLDGNYLVDLRTPCDNVITNCCPNLKTTLCPAGVDQADCTAYATENYKVLHIFPIFLSAGTHVFEMRALNVIAQAGWNGLILQNTLHEWTGATHISACTVVFATNGMTGQTFNVGEASGNVCPDGYVYDSCTGGRCIRISTTGCTQSVETYEVFIPVVTDS